jgi:hypothetical protein
MTVVFLVTSRDLSVLREGIDTEQTAEVFE